MYIYIYIYILSICISKIPGFLYSGMLDNPENVAMIGDDINNDLGGGALELGLHRYLGKQYIVILVYNTFMMCIYVYDQYNIIIYNNIYNII